MNKKLYIFALVAAALLPATWAANFGTVVSLGGSASDLALDEGRGVLYVANFSANRVDVMSLADNTVKRSINVASQPSSLSVSPDGHYLIISHYSNFAAPGQANNGVTLVDLTNNTKQTFSLGSLAPLGVSFGIDNRALIVTSGDFELFDPASGTTQVLQTIQGFTAKTLPVPPANFPPNIAAASVAASGDRKFMVGLTDTFEFIYDVLARNVEVVYYVSVPKQGPRVVSMNADGSAYTSGWTDDVVFPGVFLAPTLLFNEWPNPSGLLNVGSHVIDSRRGLVYSQVPPAPGTTATPTTPTTPATGTGTTGTDGTGINTPSSLIPPVLSVSAVDNLAPVDQLNLAENLAGKSVITADNNTVYSISDSGITVFPVGKLANNQVRHLNVPSQDIVFRGNACNSSISTQTFQVTDPSGAGTDFSISSDTEGVFVSPSSGVTPATVTVSVDPTVFKNQKGTTVATLSVQSARAVNIPNSIRVLVGLSDPDQHGSSVNVPGTLVDILSDPTRNRFYVLRQDNDTVLVYDGSNFTQVGVLRTPNTPTQMAITYDQHFLMIGADNSQWIAVYDLDTLQESDPIQMPGGHYPRSIGVAADQILVAARVAGPVHMIDRVDFNQRIATPLPTLGAYKNDVNINTVLIGSPNGDAIFGASADGVTRLFRGDTVTERQDFKTLSGAYAASSFDQYVVGNNLLDSSIVPVSTFSSTLGSSAGFLFLDNSAIRTNSPGAGQPGNIQKLNLQSGASSLATPMVESPITGNKTNEFSRSLALLSNGNTLVALTVSGFTALPFNFDANVAPPMISSVGNAANGNAQVAPGGLISIYGTQLSPISQSSSTVPLPTAIGNSCLTINGLPVPVLYVSPNQINAQLPNQASGNVSLVIRTPGGTSDTFTFQVFSSAPSVFQTTVGGLSGVATVVRDDNNELVTPSDPIHHGDILTIYLTGLGATNPAVPAGQPAPSGTLASTVVTPTVTLGGVGLPVSFSGLTPGFAGLYQINVSVPKSVPAGLSVPLVITSGGNSTTVNERVVD